MGERPSPNTRFGSAADGKARTPVVASARRAGAPATVGGAGGGGGTVTVTG